MQLTLNFESGAVEIYASCREYVAARVHQMGRPQKTIAADMDYSPSDLSRKLSQNPDDSRRFTLDDLERYVQVTGDREPIYYLVERYLMEGDDDIEALERKLEKLRANRQASQASPLRSAK